MCVWIISRPLRRITIGMLLAALAFVAAALLQIQIDVSYTDTRRIGLHDSE